MKSGDLVLANTFSKEYNGQGKDLLTKIGMILKKVNDKEFLIVYYSNHAYNVCVTDKIDSIDNIEIHRNNIEKYYDTKIELLKKKIRSVTEEDKDIEKKEKYNEAKKRLISNCKRLVESIDDEEILNRANEINNLKNQMKNVEFDCISTIRKENGTIKYSIRNLESEKAKTLDGISDRIIEGAFKRFYKEK